LILSCTLKNELAEIGMKYMGQTAAIMQETLLARKSGVVKIWLRYGWD